MHSLAKNKILYVLEKIALHFALNSAFLLVCVSLFCMLLGLLGRAKVVGSG